MEIPEWAARQKDRAEAPERYRRQREERLAEYAQEKEREANKTDLDRMKERADDLVRGYRERQQYCATLEDQIMNTQVEMKRISGALEALRAHFEQPTIKPQATEQLERIDTTLNQVIS